MNYLYQKLKDNGILKELNVLDILTFTENFTCKEFLVVNKDIDENVFSIEKIGKFHALLKNILRTHMCLMEYFYYDLKFDCKYKKIYIIEDNFIDSIKSLLKPLDEITNLRENIIIVRKNTAGVVYSFEKCYKAPYWFKRRNRYITKKSHVLDINDFFDNILDYKYCGYDYTNDFYCGSFLINEEYDYLLK